jgi:hypothetical protein
MHRALLSACAWLASGVVACATTPSDELPDAAGLDTRARIAELEAEIERDHERLMALLSEPRSPESAPLREHPELHEIARRLPGLERELSSLRAGSGSEPAEP